MTVQPIRDVRSRFEAELANRILIKDGPYGTMIQALGFGEDDFRHGAVAADHGHDQKGNNDLLNISQPNAIREICLQYLRAGADIVATNTFNANRISQADYGCEDLTAAINKAAAEVTVAAADQHARETGTRRAYVAGAVGPTNKTLSVSPKVTDPGFREVNFDQMKAVYREQIDALLDGGVDIILVETVFDSLNAKAALMAVAEAGDVRGTEVPVMVSLTLTDMAGRNLSGQTPEAFWHSVRHANPLTIGLNCSFGATEMRPHLAALAGVAERPIAAYPNAGLPNDLGAYDEDAPTTAGLINDWAASGLVNVVGGCCGTTPAHIAAIREVVSAHPPRPLVDREPVMRLAGMEAVQF
ncbi:MAG: homocysteine S-methyltransferase family protein [Pseudomonadota bacterium]